MTNSVIYSIPDLVIYVILKLLCSLSPYLGPHLFPSSCSGAYLTFSSVLAVGTHPSGLICQSFKTASSFSEREMSNLLCAENFSVACDSRGVHHSNTACGKAFVLSLCSCSFLQLPCLWWWESFG